MQATTYSKDSFMRKAVEYVPWLMKIDRKHYSALHDTCEVRGALIKSFLLVLFAFWVYTNAVVGVLTGLGDVAITMFTDMNYTAMTGNHGVEGGPNVGLIFNFYEGLMAAVGIKSDSGASIPFAVFFVPAFLISVFMPVILMLAGAGLIVLAGSYLETILRNRRNYNKYVKLSRAYGIEPETFDSHWEYDKRALRAEYEDKCYQLGIQPLDDSDYFWKYDDRVRDIDEKKTGFVYETYDLFRGWAHKFCKPVKWE